MNSRTLIATRAAGWSSNSFRASSFADSRKLFRRSSSGAGRKKPAMTQPALRATVAPHQYAAGMTMAPHFAVGHQEPDRLNGSVTEMTAGIARIAAAHP